MRLISSKTRNQLQREEGKIMEADSNRVGSKSDMQEHQLEAAGSSYPSTIAHWDGVPHSVEVSVMALHAASPACGTSVELPVHLEEDASSSDMSLQAVDSDVCDGEEELSLVAAEFRKVEAHSQLSTVIQRGYGSERREAAVRFRETLARISRGDGKTGEDVGESAEDLESMFTAEHSLHNQKVRLSRIIANSSVEGSMSHAQAGDEVMSEYSASHEIECQPNSSSSSRSASPPESPGSPGVLSVRRNETSFDHIQASQEGQQAESVESLQPLLEASGPSRLSGSEPVITLRAVESQVVVAVANTGHGSELKKVQSEEIENCFLRECDLPPDQRLLLRLEELEMKVDFLMNRLQNVEHRVPGYVVVQIPTIDALRTLALNQAKAFTLELVRSLERCSILRPLVDVVNIVESISWAVFSRLPIIGLPEKQWM